MLKIPQKLLYQHNKNTLISALQIAEHYKVPYKTLQTTVLSLKLLNSCTPLKGLTVFTDESGKTGKAIMTWKDDNG